MKWNSEHEWENFLREKVEEFEVEYEEKYWQEALASLKVHDERKRSAWSKYKWIIGGVVGIFISIGSALGIYWYSFALQGSASINNPTRPPKTTYLQKKHPSLCLASPTITHFATSNQKLASLRLASKKQKAKQSFVEKPNYRFQNTPNYNVQNNSWKAQRKLDAERLIEQERVRAVLTRWWLFYWYPWVAPEFVTPFKEPIGIELLKCRNLYALTDSVSMDKKFEKWSSSKQVKRWLGKPIQVYGGVGSEMTANKNDKYSFQHVGQLSIQFVLHPRWVMQAAARLAYGKTTSIQATSKSALNAQIPLEMGYRWGRSTLLTGIKAEQQIYGENTIKQKAFASLMFQSYYKQFMLRTGFFAPLSPNYQERWRYEVSISVRLF